MECLICKQDAKFRKVKGYSLCRNCEAEARNGRDRLNATRNNPKSKYNQLGQDPITVKEIIEKTLFNKGNEDETSRTS